MTNENKEILLKDLCARLPYGVIVEYGCKYDGKDIGEKKSKLTGRMIDSFFDGVTIRSVEVYSLKPYLRPMSSMTEEEKEEYDSFLFDNLEREVVIGYEDKVFGIDVIMRYRSWDVVQWLLEHHFDFNGLIDVHNLALVAPEGMYNK